MGVSDLVPSNPTRVHDQHFPADFGGPYLKSDEYTADGYLIRINGDGQRWYQDQDGYTKVLDDDPEQAKSDHELATINLGDVEPEEIEWLWPGRIPIGKPTLIVGDPGLGKSFLTIDLAARVSTGAKWPDSAAHAPLGQVLMLGAEDDPADTVVPRLISAGANRPKIIWVEGIKRRDKDGPYERMVDLQRDVQVIGNKLASMKDCRLAVWDPISCYMPEVDSHNNTDVRACLAPLVELAIKHRCAIVMVSHLRKGEGQAIHRIMGSLAFVAMARSVLAVYRDRDDKAKRLLLPVKCNIASDTGGLAFVLSNRHSPGKTPCIEWLAGEVTITADEAGAPPARKRGPDADAQEQAEAWLREFLANGPQTALDVANAYAEAGLSERTVKRAKKTLRVESFQPVRQGPWSWRLPECQSAKSDGHPEQPGTLGNLGTLTTCIPISDSGEWLYRSGGQVVEPQEEPGIVTEEAEEHDDLDAINRELDVAYEQEDF